MTETNIPSSDTPLLYSDNKLAKLYGMDIIAAASSSAMVSPFIAIVDSTSAVNMFLGIQKDRAFAKLFGTASSKARLPKISYFLFAARDALTIAASFNAPIWLAEKLQHYSIISHPNTAIMTSQLASPAVVQFVSTPIHLFALDLFNRPQATTNMRSNLIRKEYFKSSLARICRIGPAFGIGGIGNSFVRNFRDRV